MITVTGATGNIGRPLVAALAAAGEQVNTVSRGEAESTEYVTHYRADLSEPATLKSALDGAAALFLLTRDPALDLDPVLAEAAAAGVGRVVLVSSIRTVSRGDLSQQGFEGAVRNSGLDWTILRPGAFHSNAAGLWGERIRGERMVKAPFGDVAHPAIDPADIAAVAAKALTEDGHAGESYAITGPAAISPREQTAAIAEAIGETVRFVEQTRDEAFAAFSRIWPPEVVEGTLTVMGDPNEVERRVTGEVERLLGRPATSFGDWAKRNAAAFL
jgi:uncharacterized protein YbjT (DUF2867 family)